ncbi:MAG: type I restriction enzyme HsdR N-terminal domain-containing protein [Rhodothermales bacterium]
MGPPLNLPAYEAVVRETDGRSTIFDPIRRKHVALTPEEWVRQHFVQFLIRDRGFPAGLLAIEKGFTYQGMPCRADIVAHDRAGAPAMIVECKAPDVAIQQHTFDQIARYNTVLQASHLVVTNGMVHYCCIVDWGRHTYTFIDDVPGFDALGRDAG